MRPPTTARAPRAITLPELIAVSLMLSLAAAAVIAVPMLSRDRSSDLEGAAAVEGAIATIVGQWAVEGDLPVADPDVDENNWCDAGTPAPCPAGAGAQADLPDALEDVDGNGVPEILERFAASNPQLHWRWGTYEVERSEVADTVSVDVVGGVSGVVGVAGRSASGACLLTRYEYGGGAAPQRYAIVAESGTTPCSGRSATSALQAGMGTRDRDGGTWGAAIDLP